MKRKIRTTMRLRPFSIFYNGGPEKLPYFMELWQKRDAPHGSITQSVWFSSKIFCIGTWLALWTGIGIGYIMRFLGA